MVEKAIYRKNNRSHQTSTTVKSTKSCSTGPLALLLFMYYQAQFGTFTLLSGLQRTGLKMYQDAAYCSLSLHFLFSKTTSHCYCGFNSLVIWYSMVVTMLIYFKHTLVFNQRQSFYLCNQDYLYIAHLKSI